MTIESSQLLLLLNWMSPTFPIGSFAYSHGLEQAIADGRLTTAADVESWISDLLQQGSGWNDALLFAQCWEVPVDELNELALALAGSAERYRETTHLGRNFSIAARVWTEGQSLSESPSWPTAGGPPDAGRDASRSEDIAYPVVAGSACHTMGISKRDAIIAFLQGYCAALVSVAVRLVPLGQTNGLRVLRNLSPLISETAARAATSTLEGIGGSCIAADIAAMQHETLEPRIFRT